MAKSTHLTGGVVLGGGRYVGSAQDATTRSHTANNVWEDISGTTINFTAQHGKVYLCTATLTWIPTDTNWLHNQIACVVDGTSTGVTPPTQYVTQRDSAAALTEWQHSTIQFVIAGLSPGSRTLKLQTIDAGSSLNRNFRYTNVVLVELEASSGPMPYGAPDGWTAALETWTYASATTFTVSGDQTLKYSKGTRIKLTQTTAKYFVVVGSSHSAGTTTVTVTAGTDYTLASAAITDNYFSYAANPQGYPGWFNWTPSYTGFSSNPSGVVARFEVVGKTCRIHWVHGTPGTSNATGFTISLPVTSAQPVNMLSGRVYNNTAFQAAPGLLEISSGTLGTLTLSRDGQGAAWTASGQKSMFIDGFAYEI